MARACFSYAIPVLFLAIQPGLAVKDLLSILDEDLPPGTNFERSNAVSYQRVGVNVEDVKRETRLRFPGGRILEKVESDEGYNSEGHMVLNFERGPLEFSVLTIHKHDGYETLQGIINDPSHEARIHIQSCGGECHMLVRSSDPKRNDTISSRLSKLAHFASNFSQLAPESLNPLDGSDRRRRNRPRAEISLSCYYTQDYDTFLGSQFVFTEIAFLNRIMRKNRLNKFNIRFRCLCFRKLGLNEALFAADRLNEIISSAGLWSSLLRTADMAVAFYYRPTPAPEDRCTEVPSIDPLLNGDLPVMFAAFDRCSVYSLTRGIGLLLGARQNIEADPTPGRHHGHLVFRTNRLTIMAVPTLTHTRTIPFFSTPARTIFSFRGRRIGNRHWANNRIKLILASKRYVVIGDEIITDAPLCSITVIADFPGINCVILIAEQTCSSSDAIYFCPLSCGVTESESTTTEGS